MYINNLNDTVDEYNNTYHRIIKMNPLIKSSTYTDFGIEYQNIKTFLQKDTLQVGLKRFLL